MMIIVDTVTEPVVSPTLLGEAITIMCIPVSGGEQTPELSTSYSGYLECFVEEPTHSSFVLHGLSEPLLFQKSTNVLIIFRHVPGSTINQQVNNAYLA